MSLNKSDLSSFCSFIRTLKMNYISGFYKKGFRWRRYGVAVLAVAIALLLAPLIEHESPFLLFFAAVMVSAWYGGMGAGVLATAVSPFSDYFFLSPTYSFIVHGFGQNLQSNLFVLEGITITEVVASLKEASQRAEQSLQKALNDLKIRVENRTTELRNANEQLQSEIVERQRTHRKYNKQ